MSTKPYRITFRRAVSSIASVTVEAKSRQEAIFKAAKEELSWQDAIGEPEIMKVEIASGDAA